MLAKPLQRLFFILIGLTIFFSAEAQYSSENGLFTVDEINGCVGLTVTITNNNPVCDCIVCACNFDYNGDGNYTVQPNRYQYTYNAPGTYRMEILFSGTSDFITITIEDKPAPVFDLQRCSANGVSVVVTDDNYDSYEIDFGDGSPLVVVPSNNAFAEHTYGAAISYTVRVRGLDINSANNCPVSSQLFTAQPTFNIPTIESVIPQDPGSAEVTFTPGDPNTLYNILMSTNNTNFQQVGQVYSGSPVVPMTEIISNLNLEANYYCFRIETEDVCAGSAVSSPIDGCTIALNVTNANGGNQVNWAARDPDIGFEIYRDGVLLTTAQPGERFYEDTDLICGETYSYTIIGRSSIDMFSVESCVVANSTALPPGIEDLSIAPGNNGGHVLTWVYNGTAGAEFDIFRSVDGGSYNQLTTTTSNDYTDADVSNARDFSYCYEVVPRDVCGNQNEANVVACAFTPSGSVNSQDEVSLIWPGYTGFLNGVDRYEVEKSYDGVNFTPVSQVNDTTFFETDSQTQNQVLHYRIKVYSTTAGVMEAVSYTIRLVKSNRVFFPDAFTPDGDGLNDEFRANARFYSSFEMDIFNRWGELIFHSDNIDQTWDGNYNGKPAQQDTYVVKITLTDESGAATSHEGSLRLLR